MSYTYQYPHPAVTVDCVILHRDKGNEFEILLIKRKNDPFKGMWALPGGFVEIDESLDRAAARELREETGLEGIELKQLYAFGAVDRDPRERNIAVAYLAIIDKSEVKVKAGDDAAEAAWFAIKDCSALAFDHQQIVTKALEKIELGE